MAETATELTEYFEFLDELRENGDTNMFGAGPWLADAFGLEKSRARAVTVLWMKTFASDSTAAERAVLASEQGA